MAAEVHLALLPASGRKIKCESCKDPASVFRRCPRCRRVFSRCLTHARKLQAEIDACCVAAQPQPGG